MEGRVSISTLDKPILDPDIPLKATDRKMDRSGQEQEQPITFEDFLKVDVRVGTIVRAEDFPRARKPAYQLLIDFGPLGVKPSSAQITILYKPAELVGKQILAVVNFPAKQIANFVSEVLVLGLEDEKGSIVLVHPERPVPNGRRLF